MSSAQISQGALHLEMGPAGEGSRTWPRAPFTHDGALGPSPAPSLDSMLALLLLRTSRSGEADEQVMTF